VGEGVGGSYFILSSSVRNSYAVDKSSVVGLRVMLSPRHTVSSVSVDLCVAGFSVVFLAGCTCGRRIVRCEPGACVRARCTLFVTCNTQNDRLAEYMYIIAARRVDVLRDRSLTSGLQSRGTVWSGATRSKAAQSPRAQPAHSSQPSELFFVTREYFYDAGNTRLSVEGRVFTCVVKILTRYEEVEEQRR